MSTAEQIQTLTPYFVSMIARERGAIGIFYPVTETVALPDSSFQSLAARLGDKWEINAVISMEPVLTNADLEKVEGELNVIIHLVPIFTADGQPSGRFEWSVFSVNTCDDRSLNGNAKSFHEAAKGAIAQAKALRA